MTATAIPLPGLSAESPAAALALYGLAYLAGPRARVRWSPSGLRWHAEVLAPGCSDIDGLAQLLVDQINEDSFASIETLAKDVNELTAEGWRAGLDGPTAAINRLMTGLCAEAPLRPGGQVALTPLCVYSFGSRGTLFGNAAKQDSSVRVKAIRALLTGPWSAARNCNTLGLDPAARRQDGATMGPDPSADGVRGVPGLVPLALRGLTAVAPLPNRPRVTGGAFAREGASVSFEWPIFTIAVAASSLRMVVARRWSQRSDAQRAAAGVESVYSARVLRAERRVAFGQRVA